MRIINIMLPFALLLFTCAPVSYAQSPDRGLDHRFILGVNLGATTPVPIPGELDITRYNPKFNPKIGGEVIWFFNGNWGLGAGLTVDWKRMNVHTRVDQVHLTINAPNIGQLTGNVTGRNRTRVNTFYLTQPVFGSYRFNNKWQVKVGIYMAEALSRKFSGDVTDVVIMVETPIQQERDIPYATLNYGSDVRKFDIGFMAGGEFRMNKHVGFYADFSWGLRPYFERTVPIHFTMRNIYLSLGATFRLR